MHKKVLEVKNLVTCFTSLKNGGKVLKNISFDLLEGSSLGIVGESGSGKSSMALSLMRLIMPPLGMVHGDFVKLEGIDLLQLSLQEMNTIRGNRMSMIFQEAMTSLNPVFTIGDQIMESIQFHQKVSRKQAKERCLDLLNLVSIPAPDQRIKDYPHQISGGMRQRVMIAMALACGPAVLIADEPTTALDVTTQAQIIDLLQKLQQETHMSIILITHDLGLVAEICDYVAVMYCGRIIEKGAVQAIFDHPLHPYTQALLDSILSLSKGKGKKLSAIEGIVPAFDQLPVGCSFQDRCKYVTACCRGQEPLLQEVAPNRFVECFHPVGL